MSPGIHDIETSCAIYHGGEILVPQIAILAENKSNTRLTEASEISVKEIEIDLMIKLIGPVCVILVLTIASCGGCICYFINPDKCLYTWCRCCVKIHQPGNPIGPEERPLKHGPFYGNQAPY